MGIPTVMGADIQPALLNQRLLIVDGYRGDVLVDPEPLLVKEYQRLVTEEIELSKLAGDDVEQPAALKSGEISTNGSIFTTVSARIQDDTVMEKHPGRLGKAARVWRKKISLRVYLSHRTLKLN
jgi:phosphoenolpyruvate-protein kinase (PTS system EI component)